MSRSRHVPDPCIPALSHRLGFLQVFRAERPTHAACRRQCHCRRVCHRARRNCLRLNAAGCSRGSTLQGIVLVSGVDGRQQHFHDRDCAGRNHKKLLPFPVADTPLILGWRVMRRQFSASAARMRHGPGSNHRQRGHQPQSARRRAAEEPLEMIAPKKSRPKAAFCFASELSSS